jgi:hypothetical protein
MSAGCPSAADASAIGLSFRKPRSRKAGSLGRAGVAHPRTDPSLSSEFAWRNGWCVSSEAAMPGEAADIPSAQSWSQDPRITPVWGLAEEPASSDGAQGSATSSGPAYALAGSSEHITRRLCLRDMGSPESSLRSPRARVWDADLCRPSPSCGTGVLSLSGGSASDLGLAKPQARRVSGTRDPGGDGWPASKRIEWPVQFGRRRGK